MASGMGIACEPAFLGRRARARAFMWAVASASCHQLPVRRAVGVKHARPAP